MNELDILAARLAVAGWHSADTVVVGMSGGVDSTVTAALLLRAGFKVVGVTLRLWSEGSRCCSLDDIDDARYAAGKMGIPFYVIDREPLFRSAVVDPFVADYQAGVTPNPCTQCNATVKFAPLIELADSLGAVGVASGHYARLGYFQNLLRDSSAALRGARDLNVHTSTPRPLRSVRLADEPLATVLKASHSEQNNQLIELRRGEDPAKDQSYFLYAIPPEQRPRIRFPLAGLTKAEVREAARLLNLPVADKAESQDLCFLSDGDLDRFLRAQGAAVQPGPIVDEAGHTVGSHEGIHRYTVGQRKGLDLKATTSDAAPQYVLGLDVARNAVVVGPREHLEQSRVTLSEVVGWVDAAELPETVWLRVRHRGPLLEAQVTRWKGGGAELLLRTPFGPIAPGQAGVVYDGEGRVLLGGVIDGCT